MSAVETSPSRMRMAASALIGLVAAAVTAVAIGVDRVPMAVIGGISAIALVILAARNGYVPGDRPRVAPAPKPVVEERVAPAPKPAVEKVAKPPRPRPSLRKNTAPAPAQPLSVAEELAKLAALKDAGVLTDDEFAAQKAKLLGG